MLNFFQQNFSASAPNIWTINICINVSDGPSDKFSVSSKIVAFTVKKYVCCMKCQHVDLSFMVSVRERSQFNIK